MLMSQYESRTGKEEMIANEWKERRGPEKDARIKTPSLMCRVSPRFQPKKAKKDYVVFRQTLPPIVV